MDATEIARLVRLPFTVAPLLLVGIFAVLLQLALHAGVFGWPLLYIIGSWFLKYAFVFLEHTAQGRPGAPVLTMDDANPLGEKRPLTFGLLIGAYYGLTLLAGALLGATASSLLQVAGMLALPAVIAIHAVTGSMLQALHPRKVLDMVRGLGPGYVVVMAVAAACAVLAQWIVVDGAAHLGLLLRIACAMLLWLELFALLGGVIHQRRWEIGHEPEHSPERTLQRDSRARELERNRFIDQVFAEYRSGSSHNAWESIQRRAGDGATAIAELQWILPRVSAWPDRKLARRVALELLGLLLARQHNGAALKLGQAQLQADAQFRPMTAEQTLRLAQIARDGGDWPLARTLLSDFEQRFPAHPALARAQELAGQLQKR